MTLFLSSNISKTCELGTLPGPRKSQKLHWISNMLHKLSCCRSCFPATSSRSNTYFAAVIQYCDPKLAQFTYIIKCHCKVSLDSFIFFQNVQKVLQNRFPKSKSLLQHSPYLFSVCTLAVTSRVPSTSASPYCFVSLKCAGFHNQSGVSKPLVVFLTRWSKGHRMCWKIRVSQWEFPASLFMQISAKWLWFPKSKVELIKVILRVEMGRVVLINVAVILQLNFAGEYDAWSSSKLDTISFIWIMKFLQLLNIRSSRSLSYFL